VEEVKMSSQNEMKLIFDARSVNESFARVAVAAFSMSGNPKQR
jgi:stage II sporulation protein AB (anti-sigma F factor)